MHSHRVGEQNRPGTGYAVANEIERQLVVERRIDGIIGSDEADGIAVGRRAQHRRHADISAGADLVLDDELLAQLFRQILSDDARHGVVWPTGGERHDPGPRPRRIALRSEEHTSELQSPANLLCRLLLEKKKNSPAASTA